MIKVSNMKKFILRYVLISFLLVATFIPTMAVYAADPNTAPSSFFCQLASPNPKIQHLLSYGGCIISHSVIPLIFAIATIMFIWGVVQFVINSDEEAKKEKGKQFMIWGIIALTVMISVWGLVNILGGTFGINAGFIPQVQPVRPCEDETC